jgi:hypothetical protein
MNKNMTKFQEATKDMSYTNIMAFRWILLRRLSEEVPRSIWDMLINEVSEIFNKGGECQATKSTVKSSQVSQQS